MAFRRRAQAQARAQARARAKINKQAAKVKIPLPPKPDVKALKVMLAGIISATIEMRVRALNQVVIWYDGAVDYLIKKGAQDPVLAKELQDKIQRLSKANKARELGINPGATMPEKEQALRTSVKQFELYCNKSVPQTIKDPKKEQEFKDQNWWPQLDHFYKKYDAEKAILEKKEAAAEAKYADLVVAMTQAFPNVPVKFKVTSEVSGRKYDGSGTMLYGKDVAREMAKVLKREGILKVFANEILPITTVMALGQDANGNPIKDAKMQVGAIESVLKSFVAWAQSDVGPAKILRRAVPLPQGQPAAGNGATRPPRAPRQPGQGKTLVGNRYRNGSAIATLYLRMADGQEHTKQELFAGLGACEGGKDAPFTRLLRHVGLFNEFKIDVNGDKVQMTLQGGN